MSSTYFQYRLTIGDRVEILDEVTTAKWNEVYGKCTERGTIAVLERRLVIEDACPLWLDGMRDEFGNLPAGSMLLGSRYVGCWNVIAENREKQGVLIGRIQ